MDALSGWIEKVTKTPSSGEGNKKPESQKSEDGKKPTGGRKHFSSQNRRNSKPGDGKKPQNNRRRHHSGDKNRQSSGEGNKKTNNQRKPRIVPRENPTVPSRPVNRKSVAHVPQNRRQRPRPMLGGIKRKPSSIPFPSVKNFPKGKPMTVIPMGGLNEVGKNSMCVEYDGDMILIDIGLQFPEENMPGIDYVIPDLDYVIENKEKLKGLLVTHGHLDHIGGIHHFMEKLDFPTIYTTRLTKALIEKKLEEHKLLEKTKIVLIDPQKPESRFKLGKFTIEFFTVNHSIPDAAGMFIETDAGNMLHTGDFKFDFTPTDGMQVDYAKLVKFSQKGVQVIFADSTNALKDGFCPSERKVEENIGLVMREATGRRLIVTTFASSIGRHIAIIKHAVENGRKIFLGGRSMNENIRIAHELGVINVPRSAIRKLDKSVNDYPPEQVLILTTGSQGEPFTALSRISRDEHPFITLEPEDVIAFSSSPIPGNERALYTVVDAIHRKGAKIIDKFDIDIHASGHGFRGDLQMMHSIVKPDYIVPIHGEFFMRVGHREMVMNDMGYAPENVVILENGSRLEILGGKARKAKEHINSKLIFVDGLSHADVSEDLLTERTALAEGGLITVLLELQKDTKKLAGEPRIFSEGFLDNAQVHGVMVDHTKLVYAKLHQRHEEKITESIIIEGITPSLREEMMREVDREPVIQVVVSLV